jgi:hypothetical protein
VASIASYRGERTDANVDRRAVETDETDADRREPVVSASASARIAVRIELRGAGS